jgi:hypothetical protein
MALAAEADDGDRLALEQAKVGVCVVVDICHDEKSPWNDE